MVRRQTDCPYSPRILTFELIATLARVDSIPKTAGQWRSDEEQCNVITLDYLKVVGCAIVNCGVYRSTWFHPSIRLVDAVQGFLTTACIYGEGN